MNERIRLHRQCWQAINPKTWTNSHDSEHAPYGSRTMQIPKGDSVIDEHYGGRRRRIRQHGRIVCFCSVQGRGGAEAQTGNYASSVCWLAQLPSSRITGRAERGRESVESQSTGESQQKRTDRLGATAGKERLLHRALNLASERVF